VKGHPKVTPALSAKSNSEWADWRRDPTPVHTLASPEVGSAASFHAHDLPSDCRTKRIANDRFWAMTRRKAASSSNDKS
jgi:hypothetical protein